MDMVEGYNIIQKKYPELLKRLE